jgi:glycyl-tRNA synthetase beta chain
MTTKNLLVELFVEELPPKALKKLGEAFAAGLAESLKAQGLAGAHSAVTPFASPRRLAAHISGVSEVGSDQEVTRKLMPLSVGIGGDGKPTEALRKNLLKHGRADLADMWPNATNGPDQLLVQTDGKADVLFLRTLAKGVRLQVALQNALEEALAKLPIPKVMQYQLADGWSSVNFVRPAHGLVALHGPDVVPVQALGLHAGRETHGHRFEADMEPVMLQHADHYGEQLEVQGAVIASFARRHGEIARQLQAAARLEGLTPIDDAALLDEVTALVERPNVLLCRFEPEFLAVPQECLILTMKANQKYFPLLDAAGRLTNRFLIVSNIRPADASRVIEGNERVVRPRLADAKFFFDQDRKRTLESRVDGLDKVVYHGKLGSQGERTARVRAIARAIGAQLGGDALARQADRAALLAKADLLTDMVGEFPELQGTMGGYYARHDGEGDEVAIAIEDHYRPRFAGDELPRNLAGVVVALADKLETLVGLFGIGQVPTGDKDPFALRRHALGLIRMLTERSLALELPALVAMALPVFGHRVTDPSAALIEFVYDRLAGSLREQGYSAQEVDAVLSMRPARLGDVTARLAAVRAFAALPEAASLAAANKRVGNILKKVDGEVAAKVDAALLNEPAEAALNDSMAAARPIADAAFERGDYTTSLQALAALRAPVDAFFETVMVNAEDPAMRANRLGLLATLHAAMNRVADLSKLAS